MKVTPEDIKILSRLVNDLCGIVLDETKGYLIESRLSRVAEQAGCKAFSELHYKVRYGNDAALKTAVIDAITTNETLFFRDTSPFDALRHKALPELIDLKGGKRLRIWSAACSTGQEPYSIAMVLHELIPDIVSWDIQIRASDISNNAIAQASRGVYDKLQIQRGMPADLLRKYFLDQGGTWKVKDELRGLISFEHRNLLQSFADVGQVDVIFCRNVAIYFDAPVRADLFRRFKSSLTRGGYLFVGASESLTDLGPDFQPHRHCRAVFYRPNGVGNTAILSPRG